MKKKALSTIAALLVVVFSGLAQDDFIVIQQSSRKRGEKKIRLNDNIGVVKFTPTQMLVGEINFSYERQISKQSSFEIGLGPTISNIALGGNGGNHYIDPYYGGGGTYQTSGVGFFAEAGYRFYPLDETEALNRFYLSPIFRVRQKNYGLRDISGMLPDKQGSQLLTSFALNFGYQMWLSKSFSFDFFTGLGIGQQQDNSYFQVSEYANNTYTYKWQPTSNSYARYVFNFGMKVGIGHK
ncbi:MAG: hypothetical protein CSA03_00825 [Bacteroidetes bacterium]|nr:MAG: hypothetical protein CSA03_00825 [Bacteroidota bacterium]